MGLDSKHAPWDVLDWSQDGGLEVPKPAGQARNQRQQMPPVRCPRCDSINTKFCYYNNYSRSQPRHFCKACRRHWTEGGTLRNVPVGGGRKNKRQKTTHNTPTPTPTITTTTTTGTVSNNRNNSGSISSSNPVLLQQHQQQLVVPSDRVSNRSSIFPDILRQVLLYPPQPPLRPSNYSVNSSLVDPNLSLPIPFPSHFTGTKPIDIHSCDHTIPPFFHSSSSSSSYLPHHSYMRQNPIRDEEGLTTTNGLTTASTWQEPPPLPASTGGMGSYSSYWSCWDDDITGLADPELKQSAPNDPHRP